MAPGPSSAISRVSLGAHYVFRVKGKHAKAGNVNNALKHALSAGRRPEFILLLDADFVPSVTLLKRTLGLFAEPDVGIVQTPQYFFNPGRVEMWRGSGRSSISVLRLFRLAVP